MNAGVTDDQIIEAIEKMEELPNSVSIEREMKKGGAIVGRNRISQRIAANPKIENAVAMKGIELIDKMPLKALFNKISKSEITTGRNQEFDRLVYSRFDAAIIEIISGMKELPNFLSIGRWMKKSGFEISSKTIERRMAANPGIENAAEMRGIELIRKMPMKKLFEKVGKQITMGKHPEFDRRMYMRIDGKIIKIITKMKEVPNTVSLEKEMKNAGFDVSSMLIRNRKDANPEIGNIMQKRGIEIIQRMPMKKLFEKVRSSEIKPGRNLEFDEPIYSRIDGKIIETIGKLKDLPNSYSIMREMQGEGLDIHNTTITSRMNANPRIENAIQKRARRSSDKCQ